MPVAPRVQRGPRGIGAFPGMGRGVGDRRAPSREAPPAAASGARCRFGLRGKAGLPRGRGGEEAESPPETQRSRSGGGAAGAGSEARRGKVRGRWARGRRPRRFQLLGDAGGVRGWGAPSRRGRSSPRVGRGPRQRSGQPPAGGSHPGVGQQQRWRECGKPKEPRGREEMGGCQLLSPLPSPFAALSCPMLLLPNSAGYFQIACLSSPRCHISSPVVFPSFSPYFSPTPFRVSSILSSA